MIGKTVCAICVVAVMTSGCSRRAIEKAGMTEGERLFRAKCRACHVLPDPAAFSEEAWPAFLEDHEGGSSLSEQSKVLISRYLSDHN